MAEFQRFTPAVGLHVGLAIGQSDFKAEQRALVGGHDDEEEEEEEEEEEGGAARPPSSSSLLLPLLSRRRRRGCQQERGGGGGRSRVDIVVATPGRLMDHMERTPGFTLQHLRFLVLDEVGGGGGLSSCVRMHAFIRGWGGDKMSAMHACLSSSSCDTNMHYAPNPTPQPNPPQPHNPPHTTPGGPPGEPELPELGAARAGRRARAGPGARRAGGECCNRGGLGARGGGGGRCKRGGRGARDGG